MTKSIKKHLSVGPGGRRCPCCFPAPGTVWRKKEYRKAKRKAKKAALRLEMTEVHNAVDRAFMKSIEVVDP